MKGMKQSSCLVEACQDTIKNQISQSTEKQQYGLHSQWRHGSARKFLLSDQLSLLVKSNAHAMLIMHTNIALVSQCRLHILFNFPISAGGMIGFRSERASILEVKMKQRNCWRLTLINLWNYLTLPLLNKIIHHTHSSNLNRSPAWLIEICSYNFINWRANSADQDQLASEEASWSGSALFAMHCITEMN